MKLRKNPPQPLALTVTGIESGKADIDRLLAIPIRRGMFNGIAGNGREQLQLRQMVALWLHEGSHEELQINHDDYACSNKKVTYFACPACDLTI